MSVSKPAVCHAQLQLWMINDTANKLVLKNKCYSAWGISPCSQLWARTASGQHRLLPGHDQSLLVFYRGPCSLEGLSGIPTPPKSNGLFPGPINNSWNKSFKSVQNQVICVQTGRRWLPQNLLGRCNYCSLMDVVSPHTHRGQICISHTTDQQDC